MKPELKKLSQPFAFPMVLKADAEVDEPKGIVHALNSVEIEDRDGDIIRIGNGTTEGLLLKEFKRNPVLLWQHGMDNQRGMIPIGQSPKVSITVHKGKAALESEDHYTMDDPDDSLPRVLFRMVARGVLRTKSIRFFPLEYIERPKKKDKPAPMFGGYDITKSELRETSLVAIPANPAALVQAVKMDIAEPGWLVEHGFAKSLADLEAVDGDLLKVVVSFSATKTQEQNSNWDAAGARTRLAKWASSDDSGDKEMVNWVNYRKGFLWVDTEDTESFASYKMPHHDIVDGTLVVNFRGCAAALAALRGGRGGVDIPEAEKAAAERHIAKHYAQFDAEFPEKGLNPATVMLLTEADLREIKDGELLRSALTGMKRYTNGLHMKVEALLAEIGRLALDGQPPAEDNDTAKGAENGQQPEPRVQDAYGALFGRKN
jgi:hypothetical protein